MRRFVTIALAGLGAACVAVPAAAAGPATTPPADGPDYGDPALWVCRPDVTTDACDTDLDATVVAADGTLTPAPFAADPEAPVDCFYVYPTISRDESDNSDLVIDPDAEGYVARNQAAPLGASCRVFAPLYRQITLPALGRAMGGTELAADARDIAFGDVVAAWRHYLANDNDGRGVVLVGHSQGAGLLTRLIAEEVETNPEQADVLVAAYLAGTSVQVPEGADVGGSLSTTPICRAADQFGCVVTWSSFRATAPPPEGALFGAGDDGTVAACANPAALAGGPGPLEMRMPASTNASILSVLGADTEPAPWVDPAAGEVTTPFVELSGLATGQCVATDGFHYLAVTVTPETADPRADDIGGDLTPEWGLHLIDMNLVMGNLVQLVAGQGAAWAAGR